VATGRIGTTPVLQVRWSKAPSAGTTSLSGLDDNSVSLVYSVGYEAVYRNGVLLSRTNDYTATDGTTVTLIDATIAGDIIEIFANQTIPLSDTYSQTVANGKFINNTLTTTTGDIIYASAANTPARLGIGSTDQVLKVSGGIPAWGAAPSATPTIFGTSVYISSDTAVANDTGTYLAYPNETFDSGGYHDNATNNSRITIPSGKGGYYLIGANITWDGNATGVRRLVFEKNRTTSLLYFAQNPGNSSIWSQAHSVVAYLNAADYVETRISQTSGGNLNALQDGKQTQFWAILLGV
jgi:hypothetical protein